MKRILIIASLVLLASSTVVVNENFKNGKITDGWDYSGNSAVSTCTEGKILGGYGTSYAKGPLVVRTISNLPAHTSLFVEADVYLVRTVSKNK
jgi:hypothetical protein